MIGLLAAAAASAAPLAPKIAPGATTVGIVLLGDAGDGREDQRQVAAAIASWCASSRCDVVALLGDNFYPAGVRSPRDPQWASKFEEPYAGVALPFRPVVGNHDTYGSVRAELRYRSDRWLLPARTYAYDVGDGLVRVHVVDTNRPTRRHATALADELAASPARVDLVVGHHPVASGGAHGPSPRVVARLAPALEGADVYACGHDHHLEVLHPDAGPLLVVSGGGGAPLRDVHPTPASTFAASAHGFVHLLVEPDRATLTVVGADGAVLHTEALPPSRSAPAREG